MNSPINFLVVVTALSLFSCKSLPPGAVAIDGAAEKELGVNLEEVPNGSGQYVLFSQKATPGQMLRYVVIESETSKIVERGSLMPGYVKWKDVTSLEVLSVPGTLRDGEELSHYIRVIRINKHP